VEPELGIRKQVGASQFNLFVVEEENSQTQFVLRRLKLYTTQMAAASTEAFIDVHK